MESLQELCIQTFERDPAAQVLDFEGRWYNWGDMRQLRDRLAELIAQSGIGADAPIGFIPRNHPASIAALLTMIGQGRNIRMIYAFQAPAAIVQNVQKLQPAAIVLEQRDMSPELAAALAADGIAAITLDGMEAQAYPGLERASAATAARSYHGEPQIEILTSGTTGAPKQFAIGHAMIRKHIVGDRSRFAQGDGDNGQQPPMLLYMPVGNISGIFTILPAMLHGQRAQLLERFSLPAWVEYVKTYRPAHSGIPPSMMRQLLEMDVPAADLASLKAMGSGAAPLDPDVQAQFEDRYGIPVLVSYGATEFGGPVVGMTLDDHRQFGRAKLGSVGRAYPGCAVRVVDTESGAPLGPGEDGLLEVHAPRVQEDWIRTSDIGMIDADGFLYLKGRADGAIMRGGFKVLPETIEKALKLHPAVAEVAVVAVADERVSQVPGAVIRLNAEQPAPRVEELSTFLRQHVMATHIPVHWRFVDALPRNPSMKIDRPGVKQLFEKLS